MDAIVSRTVSLDELMRLGSNARVEVINGEIREMSPNGGLHVIVASRVYFALEAHNQTHQLGMVFGGGFMFLMLKPGEPPYGLRDSFVPDVSFTRKEDIPASWDINLPFPYAPTLAVEVMSPGNDGNELLEKVRKYLAVGTEQVWVLYSGPKELHQYRKGDSTVRTYRGSEMVDAADLLPGLQLSLSVIFAAPTWLPHKPE